MSKYVWITHVLDEKTPAYGGGRGFLTSFNKALDQGDSCNTVELSLSNHIGSHVDAPLHFINAAKSVTDFSLENWIYRDVCVVEVDTKLSTIIVWEDIISQIRDQALEATLLLIKTGMEKFRGSEEYWKESMAISVDFIESLIKHFANISAIGMDMISVSSLAHRSLGKQVHQALLSEEIRIFEDLSLQYLNQNTIIDEVVLLPLRFSNSDGAPVSGYVKMID